MLNEIYYGICLHICMQAVQRKWFTVVSPLFDPLDGAQKQEVCHVPVHASWPNLHWRIITQNLLKKKKNTPSCLTNNICASMM